MHLSHQPSLPGFQADVIDRFAGPYFFLSNFYPSPVAHGGHTYRTVEHAFQAAKAVTETDRAWVAAAQNPADAKKRGRQIPLRAGWDDRRDQVMLTLLRAKFADPDLAAKLRDTGDVPLEEGTTWGDRYWGTVDGAGENRLGRLLMQVRSELA